MSYIETINELLKPRNQVPLKVLDLFAGCGGLALGLESVGFNTVGFEKDSYAAKTYDNNLCGQCFISELTCNSHYPEADVVVGGPPCQPFSVGGHQRGINDSRNCFPAFIEAIRKVNPAIWLLENVRGLLYANKWYFEQAVRELASLGYIVEYRLLNAVNFGVPQNRERLFVVGHRGKYEFPKQNSNLVTVGEAIGDLMYTIPPESKFLTPSMDVYVKKYEIASHCINPRDLDPTKPARTLTCRNIAAPTGDMHRVKLMNGRRRRLLVREAARLQSFPDWFEFTGNETSQFYQIGNAVPPLLAHHLAVTMKNHLLEGQQFSQAELLKMPMIVNQATNLF